MTTEEKTFVIKVPVYTTESKECDTSLFPVTYKNMLDFVIDKIKDFVPANLPSKNKTKTTIVDAIKYYKKIIGAVPSLLIQVSAFDTNMYDGYFENEKKIPITKDNKIGSESNFFLLYPVIIGVGEHNDTCHYIMLVYEDPTKDNGSVSAIAKLVMKKILGVPIRNIKLPALLEELKTLPSIPELQIKYSSVDYDPNELKVKYKEYLEKCKIVGVKEYDYKDMPHDALVDIISDDSDAEYYQKKVTNFSVGKKEYKISKILVDEASAEFKETIEKIFNAQVGISQMELDSKVHDPDFIVDKLSPVLANYLSSEVD